MAQEHDILGYLQSKGVHIKRAGGYEVNVPCMFHGEDPSKRGRLYINVDPRADIPGLYYCLAGETQVLTWEGYRAIKDLAGGRSLIMTEGGKWVDAPIRSFGEQPLRRVTLQRNKRIKVIHATPEHRWLVRRKKRWVTTDELQPGQPLAYAYGQGVKSVRPSAFGVAQGITYGDGTLVNGGKGAAVCLYDDELLPYFSLSPSSSGRTPEGTPFTRVADLPAYFKRLPDLDDSRSYLYGWLSGYFAADGDVTEAGQATLWSADPRVLEFVELLCNRIGVGTYGVRGPYFGKGRYNDNPMYAISFVLSTLTPEFFVQSKHLQRYRVPDAERKSWTVVSVEETDRVEEVFCATVEGTHNFVIEGNILTGNCHVCGEKGNLVTLKRHYGDQASGQDEESFDRLEIFRLASKFYQRELRLHEDVLDWLHGPERMLTDESIERFQIGYAPQAIEQDLGSDIVKEVPTRALYRYLRDLGYEAKDILSTGLCIEKNGRIVDSLAGMVTIPYQVAGSVVDIRGRTWPDRDDRPKYKTCSGRDTRLFNTDALWNVDEVLATEGEFDAIVMTQLGYNAVAFPGAKSWQDEWEGYFGPLRRVWLIFDRDRAGEEGAEKVSAKIGPKARRIHLSEVGFKCDPTQWVAKGNGAEQFNELIAAARRGNLLVSVDEAIQEFDSIQDVPGLKFGWEILDVMIDPGLQPTQLFIVLAKTGCLTGDTEIAVNRGGKGFKIPLKKMFERWSGSKYAWDRGTPTYVQRAVDGVVRLGEVAEVWDSGVKPVFTLTTEEGRSITATAEHPFFTPEGWKKLSELEVGSEVYVNAGRSAKGRTEKSHYYYRSGLIHHPYRGRCNVRAGGNSVPLHRLVVEARMNGLELDEFLRRCRSDGSGLAFLDPAEWAVHHIDHNPFNNEHENLKVLTHEEHAAIHADEGASRNVLEQVGVETVRSIESAGEQQTYDISMVNEPHNFMANGFAVHNTGKTIMLLNMMDRMRRVAGQEDLNILFISLEQTRGEWWDRARRIYRFYNMQESDDSAARRWWQDNIFLIDRNRLTEQDLRTAVDDFEEQRGRKPDLIALDYLGYWAQSFKGERYERVSDAVMALKAIAKDLRVPIIVPHQVSRVGRDGEEFGADAARDSGVIEETADFLLTLWTPDNALGRSEEEKTGRIHARVAKSRHGGRGVLLNLQFAPLSLVMLPESDPRCSAARREITWRREYRDNWEKAIYRHRTGFEGHLDHVPDLAEQIEMDEVTRERIHEYEDNRYR